MQKRTTMMGTACVLAAAALTAGPAAADTLTGFAGVLNTNFTSTNSNISGSDTVRSWLLGGSVAMPLSDLAGLNFQADASYTHNWSNGKGRHFSEEDWNFGGSVFWATMDTRFGANISYFTSNEGGSLANGGAFGEYYFGAITAMAKGGYLNSGGTSLGGRGNYLGAAVEGYIMPDLSITASVDWQDLVEGRGCGICGRGDLRATTADFIVEYLFVEDLGVSGYIGYRYTSDRLAPAPDFHTNAWLIGVRWYLGGGSLMDHQRNGNLNPWLPGA